MKKIILTMAALLIFGAAPAFITTQTIAAAQNSETDNSAKHNNDTDAKAQNFTGTITSLNGQRFILRDATLDTWYHLDDQKQAGQFVGKKVLIVGVMDERSDMIHIMSIQETNS